MLAAVCPSVRRWLAVNLGLWGVMAVGLYNYMQRKNAQASDVLEISAKLNLPANIRKLKGFLGSRELREENVDASENMQVRKVSWEEPEDGQWSERLGLHGGPTVDLTFEERHGFLLVCSLTFQKQTTPPLPHETGSTDSFLPCELGFRIAFAYTDWQT
jgi:hypothetical protein